MSLSKTDFYKTIIEKRGFVLLEKNKNSIIIGGDKQPTEWELEELEILCGCHIQVKKLSAKEYQKNFFNNQTGPSQTPQESLSFSHHIEKDTSLEKEKNFENTGTIKMVDDIISSAINSKASDIHVEPYEDIFRIRYRLDGVLKEVKEIPCLQKPAFISRLKIMAELDIAEKRRPQDGRIRVKNDTRIVDITVSTLPTDFGEKVVLRILDKSAAHIDINNLGLDDNELGLLQRTIRFPYGIILVTGPTGSGKSTTLYSILKELNKPETNIVTIEDPIEYNLPGINQAQARPDIGFSFANALRSFLRQDPDVIMVGEIRDKETAEMTIRAALTGHLVMSTLHTNNAPATITRLIDMGVEPFLITSSAKLVIAQRLVRVLCSFCKEQTILRNRIKDLPAEMSQHLQKASSVFDKRGCPACKNTGFSGRTALFEILNIADDFVQLVNQKAATDKLQTCAQKQGMKTLTEQGCKLITRGLTTIDEVLRQVAS